MNKPICDVLEVPDTLEIRGWLSELADKYKLRFLLAHAEDGVIWGEFRNNQLVTSDSAFDYMPKLQTFTLQQCRAFGENTEVMVWKMNNAFKGRIIKDEKEIDFVHEKQILWGTKAEQISNGFTLVCDGSQGMRHAVPLVNIPFDANQRLYRPLRLCVRHYINYDDETGLAHIYLSRLVSLTTDKELANVAKA